jgi:hypothetical protein
MIRQLSVALLLLSLAACGDNAGDKQAVNRDTLTQRQKDSILARSSIPGASNVGRAMRAADSTSAGARRADSVAADTTLQ